MMQSFADDEARRKDMKRLKRQQRLIKITNKTTDIRERVASPYSIVARLWQAADNKIYDHAVKKGLEIQKKYQK